MLKGKEFKIEESFLTLLCQEIFNNFYELFNLLLDQIFWLLCSLFIGLKAESCSFFVENFLLINRNQLLLLNCLLCNSVLYSDDDLPLRIQLAYRLRYWKLFCYTNCCWFPSLGFDLKIQIEFANSLFEYLPMRRFIELFID